LHTLQLLTDGLTRYSFFGNAESGWKSLASYFMKRLSQSNFGTQQATLRGNFNIKEN
jgi:hypothetical protein